MLAKIVHPHFALVFAGDQQQMLKAHLADSGALAGNFIAIQRLALDAVAH